MDLMTKPPRFCGTSVRTARLLKGWTVATLAEQVGVTPERIRQIERGAVPSVPLLERLGQALRIDWRRLFDGEGATDDR